MDLFRESDTMHVYMASPKFTKEISENIQQYDFDICIHV